MRELLKKKLEQLEFPSADFSLHSLRAGGATAAAAETECLKSMAAGSPRVLKMDMLRTPLSVTMNLGL